MRLNDSHRFVRQIIRHGRRYFVNGQTFSLVIIISLLLPYAMPTPALTRDVKMTMSAPETSDTIPSSLTSPPTGPSFPAQPQQESRGMPAPDQPTQPLAEPSTALSSAALSASVTQLQITPQGPITLQRQQPLVLGALPLDESGNTVQGVAAIWESSNNHIVSVTPRGEALGGNSGTATLTARAGNQSATVQVTVISSTWNYGGTKPDSSRASISQSSQRRKFDPNAVSKQFGAAVILKLMSTEKIIDIPLS